MRVRTDDVSWQELDGHVVVLDLRAGEYLEINASGSFLFLALTEGAQETALAGLLMERYSLSDEQAASDAEAFLEMLRSRQLLVV